MLGLSALGVMAIYKGQLDLASMCIAAVGGVLAWDKIEKYSKKGTE